MADPVNGLLAARMDPERRRRIGNALMAQQYDRATPQDAPVTDRAGLFPLATYANGQTGIAWPGLIATPVEKMAGVLRGEITPGTPEFNEAGFDIAGAAMVGGLAAARPRNSLGMSGRPTEPQGIRAYHGSPHDFDKFDMSKIGTGEGAQAYGHGLYFAENEKVARSYRDGLSYSGAPDAWRASQVKSPEYIAAQTLDKWGGDRGGAIDSLRRLASDPPTKGDVAPASSFEAAAKLIQDMPSSPGKMYEVNIKASPDDFLDWDKPLSQQSEKVRNFINSQPADEWMYHGSASAEINRTLPYSVMHQLKQPSAAQALRDAGIPGIKYLDQGSRSAGDGSRNYVVFDANLIEILRKYGLLGMLGAGGMAQELLKPSKPTIPDDAA